MLVAGLHATGLSLMDIVQKRRELFVRRVAFGSLAALAFSALLVTGTAAVAAPLGGISPPGVHGESQVIKVHRRGRHHHHHHYRRGRVVEAPFTYVESGRRVVVEAPFTTVYVGRRGRYVRAPFVNIWIPR